MKGGEGATLSEELQRFRAGWQKEGPDGPPACPSVLHVTAAHVTQVTNFENRTPYRR